MLNNLRFTSTAIALHWLVALAIVGTFICGLYMSTLPNSPTRLQFLSYHKWAGVTIFILAVFRLFWRISHPSPTLPDHMKPWEKYLAHGTHFILYTLMLLIPITGWLMSSAKGFQTVWFGIVPLPDLVGKNKELGNALRLAHQVINYVLAAIVVGHVCAALKHHFIDKDGLLSRMWWVTK